jgi:Ca2+-binding RTX toxin-like protein
MPERCAAGVFAPKIAGRHSTGESSLSHWNLVEPLESRTLLSGTPLDWPFQGPGVRRIGRTLYIAGTDAGDIIQINAVAKPSPTAAQPKTIQVVFNSLRVGGKIPELDAAPIKRVLINGAAGNDNVTIAPTGLTPAFRPKVFVIRGGLGDDIINGSFFNEKILGEAGADKLDGGAGRDFIDGGDGNDQITGGAGMDTLIGGAGDDTFLNLEPADQRPVSGPNKPRDILTGGPGNDNAKADPADIIKDDVENKNA